MDETRERVVLTAKMLCDLKGLAATAARRLWKMHMDPDVVAALVDEVRERRNTVPANHIRAALQAIRAELRAIRNDYRAAFGAGPRPWYTWVWQILLTPLLAAVMLLFLGGLVMVGMAWDVKTRGNE